MKSIRDLVNRMPETREGLENIVRNYSPEVDEAIKKNPEYRKTLEEVVSGSFEKYSKYVGGKVHSISSIGHGVGYTADAWLATGDIVGSLGGKFLNLLAQIPEKVYSVVYAARTGNYLDSIQNIFEGLVSYLPGFTVADQGLSRIVQKRMVKDTIYKMEKKLGLEHKSWTKRLAEYLRGRYKDVKDRTGNVIGPSKEKGMALAPA